MTTERWFEQDIAQPIVVQHCEGVVFTSDNNGNIIGVKLYKDGTAFNPSGTATCNVIRPDGVTVSFDGTVSGNMISATLPVTALAVPGVIGVVLQSISGSVVTTVFKGQFTCELTTTETVVAPSVPTSSLAQLTQDVINLQNGKVNKSGDTMTGALNVPGLNALGNYPGIAFRQSAGSTPTGYITENNATRRMYFTVVPTDAGGNEVFNLPAPSMGNVSQRNFDILTTKSAKIVPVYDSLCAWGNYAIGTTITLTQPYTNYDEIIVFSGWNSTSGGNWVNIFPVSILMSPDRVLAVMGSGINTGGESMRKSLTVVDSTHITVSDGYGDNTNILIRQIFGKRYTITA